MAIAIIHSEYPDTDWRVELAPDIKLGDATVRVRLVCGSIGLPPLEPQEARALIRGLEAAVALADPATRSTAWAGEEEPP